MKERRQYDRFPLTLNARMENNSSGRKQVFKSETRDISAADTFIYTTEETFFEGTRFKLYLTIPGGRVKEPAGAQILIECEGNVVRSTPAGVAIRFDRDCQIMSLKSL